MSDQKKGLEKAVNIRLSIEDHEKLVNISNEVANKKTGSFSVATLIRTFIKKGINEYEKGKKDLI